MSVSFEMFLIDRGVCDGYTIGQWMKYIRTANMEEVTELLTTLDKLHTDYPRAITLLLVYLYPDEWRNWRACQRLLGNVHEAR